VVDGNIIWKYMTTTITLGFNCSTDKDLTRIDPEKKTWEFNCITRNIPNYKYMGMGQNPIPLVNIKIAGKWMFIPLKMVLYNRY